MKRQRLIVAVALAAAAAVMLIAVAGQTAEQPRDQEKPLLDAVMRLDVGPILEKLDRLEAELILLRAALTEHGEKMQSMQESLAKMQQTMASLKKPERWKYHLLYNTSSTAVNRLGEQGWDLVTSGKDFLVFRKPAPEQQEE